MAPKLTVKNGKKSGLCFTGGLWGGLGENFFCFCISNLHTYLLFIFFVFLLPIEKFGPNYPAETWVSP